MNIGLVIYGELNQRTGGYLYDRSLVEGLRDLGDRVEVISIPARNYVRSLFDNLPARRLSRDPYDILLQDELNHPSLFMANRRVHRSSPIVTIVHHLRSSEPSSLHRIYRRIEKAYMATVDGAIYNSVQTRSTVEALMSAPVPSVIAWPGADHISSEVDHERVQSRAHAAGPLRIAFIGNLIPRKGLHRLIEALNGIPRDRWQLSVVGSLEFDKAYSNRIRRAAHQTNIELLGTLDHSRIASLLSRSHVLTMPSAYEGFGIAYLEGMAFGLPAVASAAGGASDIVQDGINGYLLPPSDIKRLRATLLKLADDRGLLAEMGKAALDTYRRHPTWNDSVRKTRKFLMELIASTRRS